MDAALLLSVPDFDAAVAYALDRLQRELPTGLYYHNAQHTEADVLPAVTRLARLSHLSETDTHLLEVAAAFHDIGQIQVTLGHEILGTQIMAEALPRFGFGQVDMDRIAGMIMATRLPQTPMNFVEAHLADADLDSLGRDDFLSTSQALWRERAACGMEIPWPTWLQNQLGFLQSHQYFTPAAQTLRQAGKEKNIDLLRRLIQPSPDISPVPRN